VNAANAHAQAPPNHILPSPAAAATLPRAPPCMHRSRRTLAQALARGASKSSRRQNGDGGDATSAQYAEFYLYPHRAAASKAFGFGDNDDDDDDGDDGGGDDDGWRSEADFDAGGNVE
jgi:hypothetical protein